MNRFFSYLRTLLILGRVSNLPTVCSNCLAGWWLGGGKDTARLPFLFAGATFIYVGGMFLNDAFDARFDRENRPERPIPVGRIALDAVWRWGFGWLAAGALLLLWCGEVTGGLGLVLIFWVLLYDAIHKGVAFAPVIMGLCRFFLYVAAASTGAAGVTGWSIWCGLALAAYIVGFSYLARRESSGGALSYWPLLCLAVPMVLALLTNGNGYRQSALLLCCVLGLWIVRSLRFTLWSAEREIGRTVAGLLAGIVFVDWLAVADAPRELSVVFILFFGAAILFQRFVPAT